MIHVLLVDDEEDALNLLEILLVQIGDVEVVGRFVNPVQALEALRTLHVDAVFLDNEMPGMTGMEVARKLRGIQPQIPIVFTTAYAEYAVEAFEIQSIDYLLKPFTVTRLQQSIQRIRQIVSKDRDQADVFIQCMGGFSIPLPTPTNRWLPWKTYKEKELCAFLIHHDEKHVDSSILLDSIWPGYDLQKAKTYLYTCLSYLRKNFQDHHLPLSVEKTGSGFCIRLNGLATDVKLLEETLDKILIAEQPDVQVYHKVNELYKGEYLEGLDYAWACSCPAWNVAKFWFI